ncbi:MAG: hypothetical protein K6B51_01210 [Bacilli bacterium]|nr:hypothetical protein [Bacilli bacterium]
MKKVLFCLLSLPTLILALLVPMLISSSGFGVENHLVMILILIWFPLLFIINGFAIFVSDFGFGKTSFIVYLSFGGLALVDSLIMLLTFEGQDYSVMLLKYSALPIMLCVIIYRYINAGYGKDGWVANLLMPILLVAGPYTVFWLFSKNTSLLVANLVVYGIALVGAIFAVIKSLQKGLANGMWGVGSRSGDYSNDSYGSSKDFTPAQPYEIERMLLGMTARDLYDTIQYEIKRVEAHTSDGGYNFDITIYVKVDTVYGANLSRISNEYDMDRVSNAAASKLKGLVTSKLRARGVGYNLSAQSY